MNFSKINLLITGGCGFIGSNYINHIFDKVNLVVNLDAMYYCASKLNIDKNIRDDNNYFFYNENLNNLKLMKEILTKHNYLKLQKPSESIVYDTSSSGADSSSSDKGSFFGFLTGNFHSSS